MSEEFMEALRKVAEVFASLAESPHFPAVLEAAIQEEVREGMDAIEDYANEGDA